MATAPELHAPQIAAARAQAWHQAADPLLTLESARIWLNGYGLVLFAPRPALGAPAPSLLEATLGTLTEVPAPAQTETARALAARLVAEGSAVPLNLLGGAGDVPDFLASAQAFPFVFTLRGDKGWKRPPETTGAVKVTPLALRVYEVLTERGAAMAVAEIASEVGREVNEAAVARALSELWQLLRVLPVAAQGETRWELSTARFVKAIKAGANAGQPTALSALISLYLGQALVASEEEIAGFLSPLTARSRVRDVLHGLTAGRQLAEGVVDGKTVLYVPDALPDFAQFAPAKPEADVDDLAASAEAPVAEEPASPERIRRFEGARPQDRNLRGKPARPAAADRPRRGPAGDREGSKFKREGRSFGARPPRPARSEGGDRPSFDRPWDEERGSRPPRAPRPDAGERGDRPAFKRADRPDRPERPRREDWGKPAGRPPRPFSGEGRPPARGGKFADRPGFSRRPFGAAARPPRAEGAGEDRRPPRGDRPARPFRPRAEGEGDARGGRPFRPRAEGPKAGGFRDRSGGEGRPARPFRPRDGEDRPGRGFKRGPGGPAAGSGFRRDGSDRPERSDRPARPGGFAGRPRSADRGEGRSGFKPGGFRPRPGGRPAGKPGFKPGGRPARPGGPPRPTRKPRPEDEA